MYEEIERVLDQHVRPLLRGHGGDMEVLEVALVQETSRELLDQAREILRRRHGG